jgi:hypothetical protein
MSQINPIHTIPSYLPKIHFNPSTKSRIHFLSIRSFIQGIRPGPRLLVVFRNKLIFYGEQLLNLQAGGPSLVGCPRLLIQYIRSYPPYHVSSIRNLRTRHAVVMTRDPPNMGFFYNLIPEKEIECNLIDTSSHTENLIVLLG